MLTGAPFEGPVAGVRIGLVDGKPKAFATPEELKNGGLDLVVAGTKDAIMMVEAGANEIDESIISGAFDFALQAIQPAIALQEELVKKVGVTAQEYELILPEESIQKIVDAWVDGKLGKNLHAPYPERNQMVAALRESFHEEFTARHADEYASLKNDYDEAFTMALHKDVRKGIIADQTRPDGRKLDEIRPLSSEVSLFPRTHGSSLFTRGLTQAMNIVTLAPLTFSQAIDTMERDEEKRFMHHYNAPGYTVGEIRRLGSPGRREIGHSYLAERALEAVLPDETTFPYAIRSVTEIMSQNGSTSMAATCSSCLALLDAGVPLTRPVSGIAMGLMLEKDTPYILSDIADAEDFAGDMDFKVTGTEKGITALQMDMKVHGLPARTLALALEKGKAGRLEILKHMMSVMPSHRKEMSPYAPRVESITINPEKIREIIGKGGETIQRITSETGTEIDIKDDGLIMISSPDKDKIDAAKRMIKGIADDPEVGVVYEDSRVVSVLDFGAFVEIMPGKEGLVHVSEMSDERVDKPSDVVSEGDRVNVKLLAIDDRGRLVLSMKAVKK
jgi:polyribonucleotide nucleotidyltransferase